MASVTLLHSPYGAIHIPIYIVFVTTYIAENQNITMSVFFICHATLLWSDSKRVL